jgi:hypothetical protein
MSYWLDWALIAVSLISLVLLLYGLLLGTVAVILLLCRPHICPAIWKALERFYEVHEDWYPALGVLAVAWVVVVALIIINAVLEP